MKAFTPSLILALAALVAADSHLDSWSGSNCNSGDHLTWTAPPSHGPNTCKSVGNVKSIKVNDLGSGCTATVYTDSNCSNNAKAARVGQCVQFSGKIGSFSVDCP
ncbi:uncharacterized protein BDR25DRAFT_305778 [Lindgomyces ingoldianus]|uniref:Uncharacterized protein n=1 Tax=Lindgomyces ingoldianus TaxID=673940 RepID=A0ACB6QJ78_9PLEO|nr:uncharacterized protein BDR25DRAFT_305778 [Lindgomyces ingoldianus]KAF2466922.1 hypothetical protein BDR25DRAFT_305778 [Lindgomyces ingoldianus]